ncbi:uncharacterized protein PAC_18665 [Phialocephala subalpina]|uniref:Uncharacterized protein n=1 Tax=Phialocephala subalpina TaxID=576137 RepID=A0A1L7XUS1_9HELO|nr:uncharacterized protein PAC_18665 [Phialocephala subalpina]
MSRYDLDDSVFDAAIAQHKARISQLEERIAALGRFAPPAPTQDPNTLVELYVIRLQEHIRVLEKLFEDVSIGMQLKVTHMPAPVGQMVVDKPQRLNGNPFVQQGQIPEFAAGSQMAGNNAGPYGDLAPTEAARHILSRGSSAMWLQNNGHFHAPNLSRQHQHYVSATGQRLGMQNNSRSNTPHQPRPRVFQQIQPKPPALSGESSTNNATQFDPLRLGQQVRALQAIRQPFSNGNSIGDTIPFRAPPRGTFAVPGHPNRSAPSQQEPVPLSAFNSHMLPGVPTPKHVKIPVDVYSAQIAELESNRLLIFKLQARIAELEQAQQHQRNLSPSFKQELLLSPSPEPAPIDWSFIGYSDPDGETISKPPYPILPERRLRQFERIEPAQPALHDETLVQPPSAAVRSDGPFMQSSSVPAASGNLPTIGNKRRIDVQEVCVWGNVGQAMWRKMVAASTFYMSDSIKGEMLTAGPRLPELLVPWMEVMSDALDLDEYELIKNLTEPKRQHLFCAVTKEARKPLGYYYHKGKKIMKDVGEVGDQTWTARRKASKDNA